MSKIANEYSKIEEMVKDKKSSLLIDAYFENARKYKFVYNFTWLGRPIIQHPADILALQEIVYEVKPEIIIETGIAHGGSILFYASILEIIGGDGKVIGIDVDIKTHNRIEIEKSPLMKRIMMLEGSSTDEDIVSRVGKFIENKTKVLVVLDSNHTHDHVLKELQLYSPFVSKDSYLVVFDSRIEDMPDSLFKDRPWGKGNNPKTAVWEFLKNTDRFEIDKDIEKRILLTGAPDGFLRCIKN